MRMTLDSLLPLNEPQRTPTDHNADTNVSARATVRSISHCLARYMDVAVFLVLEHCLYSHKMPEFKGAWHRAKPKVVITHCANRMNDRTIYLIVRIPYA